MFSATGGVNTHKGLIFSFALLCGALGKVCAGNLLAGTGLPADAAEVFDLCQSLGTCSLKDFEGTGKCTTAGEACYTAYKIPGARGEAAAGFPSARAIGLPALKAHLSSGWPLNDAAVLSLLTLIAEVDDTNMIHRGGLSAAMDAKKEARRLLSEISLSAFKETMEQLDQDYIRRNLSPGGCADLLAVSLLLLFLEDAGLVSEIL